MGKIQGNSYANVVGNHPRGLVDHGGLTGKPRVTTYQTQPEFEDDPSARSQAVIDMMPWWQPMNICALGTDAVKEYAEYIVPRENREDDDAYNRRIYHAVLPPFVQRLASQAAGTILRKGIHMEGGDEDYWNEWAKDVTGDGTTLNEFCRRTLVDALLFGHTAVVVDYPPADGINTLRDETEAGRKPYLVPVSAQQIRGWRTVQNRSTSDVTMIRYAERVVEPVGRFGEEVLEQVRVLTPGGWEVWRYESEGTAGYENAGWYIHQSGETTLDQIPMEVIYSNQISTLVSKPPLLECANLNIAYAQRFTDYYHSIHVGAQPILCFKGFDPDDDQELGLSVNTAALLPPEGDCFYVSPPSDVYEAQLKLLMELEKQISTLGISTLAKQNITNAAAEAKRLDRIDSDSIMSIISENLASSISSLLKMAGEYAGREAPTVTIPKDYENRLLDGNQITAMLQLQMQGQISQSTLLRILQEGEILPPYIDVNDEILATKDEMEEKFDLQVEQADEMMKIQQKNTPEQTAGGVNSGKANTGSTKGANTLSTPMRPGKHAS